MLLSIKPRELQFNSRAKISFKTLHVDRMASLRIDGLSSGLDHPGLMHSDTGFTTSPRREKKKKAMSNSPSRPMSDGITMGASSIFDRLMMSMGKQNGGASTSTRLQPQLMSSSVGLTPVLGMAGDFANVMTDLEELRRDITKRIDLVEEGAQQGQERLKDELAEAKSQAKSDQAQLSQDTDQCLAESLAMAATESEKRDGRKTREID